MAGRLKKRRVSATLRSGKRLNVPAWEIDSGRPGAVLLVMAAQHGNEVQGSEVVRRFVEVATDSIQEGKVFGVPFANPAAVRERRPHISMNPEQAYSDHRGHNMNRTWPGRADGNDTARVSHALHKAFGEEATHVFDLHCWSKCVAPAVLARDVPEVRDLARKLGHRFVKVSKNNNGGQISALFCSTGRIGITYEFSGQYLVDEAQVRHGLRLAENMAKSIGILPGTPSRPHRPVLFLDETETVQVKAPRSGLFTTVGLELCGEVREGELLGHLLSEATLGHTEIKAPVSGYLSTYGVRRPHGDVSLAAQHPFAVKGELLATIVKANG